ncbi:MAG: DUF3552 domain-containing protein [Clostridia bacterium]|nr:DUF3552 domain-containing protein [Clostridia bacterium]
MNLGLAIGLIAAALIVGAVVGFLIRRLAAEKKIGSAEAEAKRILTDCAQKAEALKKEKLLEAKEEILRLRNETEAELKERRAEVTRMERRLTQKEENLENKVEALDRKNELLEGKLRENDALRAEIAETLAEHKRMLETLAGLTAEEAKEELIERVEGEIKHELA